jgi:hypothetical protein
VSSAWLPVVTLVGGYGLKVLDDLRKENREDRRAREQRQVLPANEDAARIAMANVVSAVRFMRVFPSWD